MLSATNSSSSSWWSERIVRPRLKITRRGKAPVEAKEHLSNLSMSRKLHSRSWSRLRFRWKLRLPIKSWKKRGNLWTRMKSKRIALFEMMDFKRRSHLVVLKFLHFKLTRSRRIWSHLKTLMKVEALAEVALVWSHREHWDSALYLECYLAWKTTISTNSME